MKKIVQEFWGGSRPLWQAFWLLFIVGHFVLFFPAAIIFWSFVDGPLSGSFPIHVPAGIITLIWLPYVIFVFVAVLRCSPNVKFGFFKWTARAFMVFWVVTQVFKTYQVWTYWVPLMSGN